jgi:DNA-binding response OmpR family regulator
MFRPHLMLDGRKILVVDDSKDVASVVAEFFSLWGCQATAVTSPDAALMLLGSRKYDLLVLDVGVDEMSGLQVLPLLMKCWPDMLRRTILMTAMRYDHHLRAAMKRHGLPCLLKPFDMDELGTMAESLIDAAGRPILKGA